MRLGNIYGVGLFTYWETVIPKFVKQALDGKPLTIYGTGDQGRDFVHVLDVTNAIILALENKNASGIFNLGSGKTVSVNAIANTVSQVFRDELGKNVETVRRPRREGEPYVEDFRYSTARIKSELGFEVQRSIREGVEQTLEYAMSSFPA